MSTRKTANDVSKDLSVVAGELNAHERECNIRWKQIFRKTDDLQTSVQSMKNLALSRSYNNYCKPYGNNS